MIDYDTYRKLRDDGMSPMPDEFDIKRALEARYQREREDWRIRGEITNRRILKDGIPKEPNMQAEIESAQIRFFPMLRWLVGLNP